MKKIPQYHFSSKSHLEFEITFLDQIYKKSKSKMVIPHRQDFFGLFYYTQDSGTHFVDFKAYDIKKNSLIIISNEQVHYFKNIEQMAGKVIFFTKSFLSSSDFTDMLFESDLSSPQILLQEDAQEKLAAIFPLIEKEYHSPTLYKKELLSRYLEILLVEIFRICQKKTPLEKDSNYLRFSRFKKDLKNYYKSKKSVKFYADKQFITAKTLNLATRQIVGKSAKEFIDEYIVLLAKRILVNSNSTSKEVAYELGFYEASNFSKFFRRIENTSPALFQKHHKISP